MAINFRSNTIIKNLRVGPLSGGGNGGGGGIDISTTNLQLYWDMGNSTSYSGTGTTITDLSGNGNDGVLTGTPTYSSAGASSYLDWSGDNTAFATYNSTLYQDTLNVASANEITVSNWITLTDRHSTLQNTYIGSSTDGDLTIRQFTPSNDDGLMFFAEVYNSSLNTLALRHPSGNTIMPYSTYGLSSSDFGNWFNFTVTAGTGYYRIYVNGIEQFNTTYDSSTYFLNRYKFAFGAMLDGYYESPSRLSTTGFSGKWGNSAVYNRALPASEVLSNFDALKSRYGY